MHMADALLSPVVGGTMWAVSAGSIAYCSSRVRKEMDNSKVPLMGVVGAFLFAAQMINFTIPATGSSGHLGGGVMLAILLGPYAAFLTIASVLFVQALFFADGGILALGSNIFNIGFWPSFVIYPLVYKKITGSTPTPKRLAIAGMISAVIALQLGSISVVLETLFSGISSLPFSTFVLLMQPIHLAIGVVEGFVTVAVISFVYKARPEILASSYGASPICNSPLRNVFLGLVMVAVVTGGFVSWFASENPDGLEWTIKNVTGKEELEGSKRGIHGTLARIQEVTAFLPDYSFKQKGEKKKPGKAANHAGTSVSGLVGGVMILVLAFLIGFILKRRSATA